MVDSDLEKKVNQCIKTGEHVKQALEPCSITHYCPLRTYIVSFDETFCVYQRLPPVAVFNKQGKVMQYFYQCVRYRFVKTVK